MLDSPPVGVPPEMSLKDFLERIVNMLEAGRLPYLRTNYADGQPVNIGFYLVPDHAGLCADCKRKVN